MIHELKPGEATLVQWTDEEYFAALDCVSRSSLDLLMDDPETYRDAYEDRIIDPPSKSSDALYLGTLFHLRVLQPDEWHRRLAPPPPTKPERPLEADGRAKAGTPAKEAYTAWKLAEEAWQREMDLYTASLPKGALQLSAGLAEKVERMAAAVARHESARQLLAASGPVEQAIVWRHPSGVFVRVKVDKISHVADRLIVLTDLKSESRSAAPDTFSRAVADYGYHRQSALYIDAARAAFPDHEVHFVDIVCETDGRHRVACYEIDDADVEIGRREYQAALFELIRRRMTGDWKQQWQRGCQYLALPKWYRERT